MLNAYALTLLTTPSQWFEPPHALAFQLRRTHITHRHLYGGWSERNKKKKKKKKEAENERGCVGTELKVSYESSCMNTNFSHKSDCIVP